MPKVYTKEDAKNYSQILFKTHAIKKHFNPSLTTITSNNTKFKKIVGPFMMDRLNSKDYSDNDDDDDKETIGNGMSMTVSDNSIDYVYWDDPNELVTRLQLLLASESAGNTGVGNEIVSIVEELREADIIE